MPRLYVLSGKDIGRTYDFEAPAVLGRGNDADVVLHGNSVSRRHARIDQRSGTWRIVDMDSSNGVKFRGERVSEQTLTEGVEFMLGDLELRFRAELHEQVLPHAAAAPEKASRASPPETEFTPEPIEPEIEFDERSRPDQSAVSSSDEGGFDIELEGDWSDDAPAPQAPLRSPGQRETPQPKPAPSAARERATDAAQRRAAAMTSVGGVVPKGERKTAGGRRVLQYNKVEDTGGVLSADLGQQPMFVRWSLYLAVIALFVGLVWGAYKLTSSMRRNAVRIEDVEQ